LTHIRVDTPLKSNMSREVVPTVHPSLKLNLNRNNKSNDEGNFRRSFRTPSNKNKSSEHPSQNIFLSPNSFSLFRDTGAFSFNKTNNTKLIEWSMPLLCPRPV